METGISIVTVSYNSENEIKNLIQELTKEREFNSNEELIIVTNSGDCLTITHPGVKVIDAGCNLGFAKACNLGAANANFDVLCFCNPDMLISLEKISELASLSRGNKEFGIVTPRYEVNRTSENDISVIDKRMPGCCYVIRQDVFNSVNGWDANFFLWGEDTDLTERIKGIGFKNVRFESVLAVHLGGHSWNDADVKKIEFFTKVWISSQLYLAIKRHGVLGGYGYCLIELTKCCIRLACRVKAYGRAYNDISAVKFLVWLMYVGNLRHLVVHGRSGYLWQKLENRNFK